MKGSTAVSAGKVEEYDDGRSYNANAVRLITQEWVDKHMLHRLVAFV